MRLVDADKLFKTYESVFTKDVLDLLKIGIDAQPTFCGIKNEAEVKSERECLEQIVSFIHSEIDTLQLLISAIKEINTKIDRLADEIKSLQTR